MGAGIFLAREKSEFSHRFGAAFPICRGAGCPAGGSWDAQGGLGEQFRFFQAIDTPDIIESILKCKDAKGEERYDAFVSLNSTDPALYEAREILEIPVLGFLETTALVSCMMGRSFSLITPNPKFALSYGQKLKLYGLTERLTSIEAMNFPHLPDYRNAFIDPAAHQRVMDEFDRVARRAVEAGAEVIIPCGSHAVLQARRGRGRTGFPSSARTQPR